jgi:ketosteroid isomerase-like protein
MASRTANTKGTDLESELLALERRYWQALKENDIETALQLTDDPCIVTGAQGVSVFDKPTMAKMMEGAPASYTLNDFSLSDDAQVRMLADDVAIVAYKVHEDLTVEGKPVSFDAAESSTWVRRDDGWVCALHTEALAGDPFGRDRGDKR